MGVMTASGEPGGSAALGDWLRQGLLTLAYLYFAGLAVWMLLWAFYGDRWPWLFAVNSLAAYLFLGLPVTAAVALGSRRLDVALWTLMGGLVWAYFFGGLFVPRHPTAEAAGPSFKLLTMNVLGYRTDGQGVVDSIRRANPDVVALQELNGIVAEAVQQQLSAAYPYQVLKHAEGVTGSGIISRFPLTVTGQLPGPWLGTAQVVRVSVDGREFTLVRGHTHSGPDDVDRRNAATTVLVDYVAAHPGPLVVAGDFNTTPLTEAYRAMTGVLRDSWVEAGWGLGHTFPGAATTEGSSRPRLLGVPVPKWLVRIDYVFHSDDFVVRSAKIGPWDGISDHRPVLVELEFK